MTRQGRPPDQLAWDWEQIEKDWSRGQKLRALRDAPFPATLCVGTANVSGAMMRCVLKEIDDQGHGQPVQVSRSTLARLTGRSDATVRRAISGLCQMGLLVRRRMVEPVSGQRPNLFQIVWPNLLDPPEIDPDRGVMVTQPGGHGDPPSNKDPRFGTIGTVDKDLAFRSPSIKTKSSSAPGWPRDIPRSSLSDPAALQRLSQTAADCGFVPPTDAGRLQVFTLAAYCLRQFRERKTANPQALLTSNLRSGRRFGDHADEATAQKQIRAIDGQREQPRTADLSVSDPGDRRGQL